MGKLSPEEAEALRQRLMAGTHAARERAIEALEDENPGMSRLDLEILYQRQRKEAISKKRAETRKRNAEAKAQEQGAVLEGPHFHEGSHAHAPADPMGSIAASVKAAGDAGKLASQLANAAARELKAGAANGNGGAMAQADGLAEARAELADDALFGAAARGATRIKVTREVSSDPQHNVKGVSPGWLENLPIAMSADVLAITEQRHGGGVFTFQAITAANKIVSTQTHTIAGRAKPKPKPEDDEEEEVPMHMRYPFGAPYPGAYLGMPVYPGVPPYAAPPGSPAWYAQQAALAAHGTNGNGNGKMTDAEMRLKEMELRLEQDAKKEEARMRREEARIAEAERKEEARAAKEEARLAREAADRRASEERMQASNLQLFQTMMTSQQAAAASQTQILTAVLAKNGDSGGDSLKMISGVMSAVSAIHTPLFDTLRASIEGANAATVTDKLISTAVEAGPAIVEKVIDKFPGAEERARNREASKVLNSVRATAQRVAQQAQRQPAQQQYILPDGRRVPVGIAQEMGQAYVDQNLDPDQDVGGGLKLIDYGLMQWCDEQGVPVPQQRAALPAPRPPMQAPAQPPPTTQNTAGVSAQVEEQRAVVGPAAPVAQPVPAVVTPSQIIPPSDPTWMNKACLRQLTMAFQSGMEPLAASEFLAKRNLLSEKARRDIGRVFEQSEESERMEVILERVFALIEKNGATPDISTLLLFQNAFKGETEEEQKYGVQWLEGFLWVCAQPSIEEAKERAAIEEAAEAAQPEEVEQSA